MRLSAYRISTAFVAAACGVIGAHFNAAAADDAPAAAPVATDAAPAEAKPEAKSQPKAAPVAPEKIAEWVVQLEDDHFAVRETAQQQLAAAGAQALAGVGQAAAGGSLESSTRAVNVLLSWSQSPDTALSLGALEQLAALKNRPAESAMAADRLAEVREIAAIKAIVDLGGRVDYDQQIGAFNGVSQSLQVVIGPQWKGGLDGLSHLEDVRRASTVSFHSSTLGEDVVGAFPQMAQLQRIEFYGVTISPEALEKLKKRAPNAAVEIRSGARLGIVGSQMIMGAPNPAGATGAPVQKVLPGSSAGKAGIQAGDVITEIAGSAIKDFPHLTREIAKCQPGEKVQLKLLRQGPPGQPMQTIDVTVEFDRWGDEPVTPGPGLGLPGGGLDPTGVGPIGLPRGTIIINQRR